MERTRSIAVAVAAALGLLGIGLIGVGERLAGSAGVALAQTSGGLEEPVPVGSASRCDAPRDGFCPIGHQVSRAGREGGSGR